MGNRLARPQAVLAGLGLAVLLLIAGWLLWPAPTQRTLLVGVDDDTLKWTADPLGVVAWQRELGADAVRVWVPWQGERRPEGSRVVELQRAEQAATRTTVVLAVFGFGNVTPRTPGAQRRFCGYARAVLRLVPDAKALVVWNEANSRFYWNGTPAEYERLLARCYDVLHRPGLTILDSTASSHDPAGFLEAVGAAYRRSGRTRPVVDAFGHNPYPRTSLESPLATHGPGFIGEGDYARLLQVLRSSFGGDPTIWYLEDGFQTTVPRALRRRYGGRENVETVDARGQAVRLGEAIAEAACQPRVHAFFNFELVDESRLAGWQSGLIWRGVRRKPAAKAFATAPRRCP